MNAVFCPICGRDCGAPILCREQVPVFLNQVYSTPETARRAKSGRMELAYCAGCGFGFNAAFDPSLAVYGREYENEQSHSPTFGHHIDRMVERVVQALGSGGGAIIEVGCGQGEFLRRLAARVRSDEFRIVGVDPCYRAGRSSGERIEFFASALEDIDPKLLPPVPSAVLSRHVIEHIARPVEFLRTLVDRGVVSVQSQLLLETPSFEWIVRNRMFMDIFYEHCCYFTRVALMTVATAAGFRVNTIDSIFGGQYYWVAARAAQVKQTPPVADNRATLTAAEVETFVATEAGVRSYWLQQIEAAARRAPVAVWGAGAKGITFATLLDQDRTRVTCLIDLNSAKQDRFIPLSGHPILSVESARRAGVATAFIMNPNYLNEIRLMTADAGASIDLIPVHGAEDALHV